MKTVARVVLAVILAVGVVSLAMWASAHHKTTDPGCDGCSYVEFLRDRVWGGLAHWGGALVISERPWRLDLRGDYGEVREYLLPGPVDVVLCTETARPSVGGAYYRLVIVPEWATQWEVRLGRIRHSTGACTRADRAMRMVVPDVPDYSPRRNQ